MAIFLRAQWRYLLMLNYAIAPDLLKPHLPRDVELDEWNATTCVSMVGFRFLKTRVLGIPLPGHVNFDEVNLRFYVRRKTPAGWRRGVVFIREIVPRRLIAAVARVLYNEPYLALPMRHKLEIENGALRSNSRVEYEWRFRGEWNSLGATITGTAQPLVEGSEEQFITEHFWGYTAMRHGATQEYRVEHPSWNVWRAENASFRCDVASLYGEPFAKALNAPPRSAFVAEGSAITVGTGNRLEPG
jgi:uncharacterized protein YqjF (DUF2071 family)